MATILIIDQSRFTAKHLSGLINANEGLEAAVAYTAQEGLLQVAQIKPACILLDAGFSDTDLAQYCQKLSDLHPSPIVLVYTPIPPFLDRVAAAKASHILTLLEKPFSDDLVFQTLLEAMNPQFVYKDTNMDNRYQWLKSHPDVLGYAILSAEGYLVETEGVATAEHCGVLNYLLDIGSGVGQDLGLEHLEEMQIFGKDNRVLSARLADGTVNVVTGPKGDIKSISQKIQG